MKTHHIRSLLLISLLPATALAGPAHAEPSEISPEAAAKAIPDPAAVYAPTDTPAPADRFTGPRFALGVSSPFGLLRGSLAADLSVGVSRHHAVRASVARYEPSDALDDLAMLALGGDGSTIHSGRVLDVSASWVYYPRRLWDGFMFEVGALRRQRNNEESRESSDPTTTRSVIYGGRMAIGWSWPVTRYGFISAATGFALGRETGEEQVTPVLRMPTKTAIDRDYGSPELYLRFGLKF